MPVHWVAWNWQPGQQDFKVGALPCPSCLVCHSQESPSFLPQLPGSTELFVLISLSSLRSPEEMQRFQCLTRSWGRGRGEMGWAQPLVACPLPVQAFPASSSEASPLPAKAPLLGLEL